MWFRVELLGFLGYCVCSCSCLGLGFRVYGGVLGFRNFEALLTLTLFVRGGGSVEIQTSIYKFVQVRVPKTSTPDPDRSKVERC